MVSAAVLLHGFTLTGRSWDPVLARLPPEVDARALDLRGHGAARDARPIDVGAVVEDVAAATPAGATLGGYSLGGRVALRAALDRPGRFGRLVLVGATAGIADPAERARRRAADAALAARMEGMTIEAFADEWGALDVFATQPPEVRAVAHADRLHNDPPAPGRGAARARAGGDGADVGPPGRARPAGHAGRRRPRPEVRRPRPADGRADRRRGSRGGAGRRARACTSRPRMPWRGCACISLHPETGGPRGAKGTSWASAKSRSVASPHAGVGCSAAAACTPAAIPTGPS